MINREELPDTLKKWEDLAIRLDQNKEPTIREFVQTRKRRYLYPDNIFPGDKDVITREYNPIRDPSEPGTWSPGKEYKRRIRQVIGRRLRKEGKTTRASNATGKDIIAEIVERFNNFQKQGEFQTNTGNREPNMYESGEIEDAYSRE